MASGTSSPIITSPASSSAVTIPVPGKSILKRPPPQQQSFFSLARLSKLLPATPVVPEKGAEGDAKALKRAHFILPQLTTVYPISAANPPSMPTLKEEKRNIEQREAERRRRIVRGNNYVALPGSESEDPMDEWWSMEKVESFYRECCESREEVPNPSISTALKHAGGIHPRTVDLSGVQLTLSTAAVLSDILCIEWGLRKLVFRECDLDEHILKPILHALLIPESIQFLSVASNRRLKTPAYRLLSAYMGKAKALQFLDLSQNALDKKAIEYISTGLAQLPNIGLESLRLDDCQLKPASLETLGQAVRTSSLRNISLRHNRITATSTVALALMIKDYPDVIPAPLGNGTSPIPSAPASTTGSPSLGSISLPTSPITPPSAGFNRPPATANIMASFSQSSATTASSAASTISSISTTGSSTPNTSLRSNDTLPPPPRAGPLAPPPRHPTQVLPQTTYTPYVPRSKRVTTSATPLHAGALPPANGGLTGIPANPTSLASRLALLAERAGASAAAANPLANGANGHAVPVITSNAQGGVTTRHVPAPAPLSARQNSLPSPAVVSTSSPSIADSGPSAALLYNVRALDSLPRLGALQTLDLRGNDIRAGVTYIAQVLKRNRTLKVLNLGENKLDVPGLMAIAEALKYNSCLETLDLSRNPCCGPSLDGIQSLRTAFTLNTALKQLFLASTGLTSAGTIALAEFLPEAGALLHLGLTENALDIAALHALNGGLKSNHVMRCLDLSLPPGDEAMAKVCREIFNTCVRNAEEAEKASREAKLGQGGDDMKEGDVRKAVWGMIEKSQLAKTIRQDDAKKNISDAPAEARACKDAMEAVLLKAPPSAPVRPMAELDAALAQRAEDASGKLAKLIQKTSDPARMTELLALNDSLTDLLAGRCARPKLELHGLGLDLRSPDELVSEPDTNEEEEVATPRIDKGKGKAPPEPPMVEKVLTPTFVVADEDDEGRRLGYEPEIAIEEGEELKSPSQTDRSRIWVEEEGEVFRKGSVLLGPEEMEGDYDGEELRVELLEAEVERPPPRAVVDDAPFGMNDTLPPLPPSPAVAASPQQTEEASPGPRPYMPRRRSSQASIGSPSVMSPTSPVPPVGLKPSLARRLSEATATVAQNGSS